jgi:uridylate kinase
MPSKRKAQYKRVVLKISGECLGSPTRGGVDPEALAYVAGEVAPLVRKGIQVGLVVGGGNLIRGRDFSPAQAVHRLTADYMGMLATVINALALQDALEAQGTEARVLSAIPMGALCEAHSPWRAMELLDRGIVVIFAAGTGSPLFTTDMCAALRAAEVQAQAVLKATKVDGVYDSDPEKNPKAKKYRRLTFQKAIRDRLGVMDLTAISLCMESHIPIVVFRLFTPGTLRRALSGEAVGTIINEG